MNLRRAIIFYLVLVLVVVGLIATSKDFKSPVGSMSVHHAYASGAEVIIASVDQG